MTEIRQQSAGSIGIGIIGTGEITRIMRPAFTESTQARVVAVADVNMDAARAEAEALGGAEVFADYRELLASPAVQAVYIATPPFLHREMVLAAMEAGKHVLCEKPFMLNQAEAREIAGDKRWTDIAELWLGGDHYKWRAMRTAGVDERFCTGDATPWEKFAKYAETMPQLLRNPLYHWSHLELARYFGIDDRLLGPSTAKKIFDRCNEMLLQPGFTARGFMERANVETVCTTDDPVDSLEHHRAIAADKNFQIRVLLTWRPDKALFVDRSEVFRAWLGALEKAAGMTVSTLDDLMSAIQKRHDFFADHGCRLSDRGIDTVSAEDRPRGEAAAILAKARAGQAITTAEAVHYKSFLLHELAVMDAAKGWTMQIHYGALRSANSRMLRKLGPDTGFDSIRDWPVASAMARHFDRLDNAGSLPKTIIYNLNPRDNEVIATMLGNFQDGITAGKMQFGSGWWFLDQLDGMTRQIEALSQMGLLGCFVGMLTDSRSFLYYTRHEYFRRLLCNILGLDMQRGLIPDDESLVGPMVRDISYGNARDYFGFGNS